MLSSSLFWREVKRQANPFPLEGLIFRRKLINKHHLRLPLNQHFPDLFFVKQLFTINPDNKVLEFDWAIYHQNQPHFSENLVLFFSHEMSLSGAPLMVYYAALAIKQTGGNPVIISLVSGALVETCLQAAIDVKITENLDYRFTQSFKHTVINTAVLPETVRLFQQYDKNREIIWWIHECGAI